MSDAERKGGGEDRHVVGRVGDLADGSRIIVEVKGHSIGVFNSGGEYFALLNRCPHAGAELCRGSVVPRLDSPRPGIYERDDSRPFIECPWHGWEFDLATGQSYLKGNRAQVRSYSVGQEHMAGSAGPEHDCVAAIRSDGDLGRRPGPFRAEVIPIDVEGDYLVIQLRRPRGRGGSSSNGGRS
jgi:3-phenylpropionate/trans-cinnamate dioxygenase ferredoxin subunit